MTSWTRYLIGIGIGFFILANLPSELSQPLSPILGPLSPIISIWWLFLLAGIGLIAIRRWNIDTPVTSGGSAISRHDIIEATNWSRLNRIKFRQSIAMALLVAPLPLLLLAVILERFDIALIWAVLAVIGGIWLLSLSRIQDITHDFTRKVEVRIPDLFSLHSFHLYLRQTVEDLGYVTTEETSPERGGVESRHQSDVFLAEGGFTARKEAITPSQSLSDDSTNTSDSDILTTLTFGVFLLLFGITIIWLTPDILTDIPEDLQSFVSPAGQVMLLVGIIVMAYDYYSRTNQRKEIFCVEEGTIYSPTIGVEDREGRDVFSSQEEAGNQEAKRETEVSTSQTSGVMIVTIGARSSPAVDEEELENDFEEMTDAIKQAVDEHELKISEVMTET